MWLGLATAEVFEPRLGEWRLIAPMSTRRSSVGVGVVGGQLYAVGGYDGASRQCLSSVERFDPPASFSSPNSTTFTGCSAAQPPPHAAADIGNWEPVADMSCRRSGAGVGVVDGLLYAVGGHDGPLVRNSVEVYNLETNQWRTVANMHLCRRNAGNVSLVIRFEMFVFYL